MTRRYKATAIEVTSADTRLAEAQRERARPKPEPVIRSEETPAPPTPPTPKQPKARTIVVEKAVHKAPKGGAVLTADQVQAVEFALMRQEAHSTGQARANAIRARRSVQRSKGRS